MFFINEEVNRNHIFTETYDSLNLSEDKEYIVYPLLEASETDSSFWEKAGGMFFSRVKVNEKDKTFIIKGIDADKLVIRIREMYKEKRLDSMFAKKYTWWSEILWKSKRIRKRDMEIKNITAHLFFALEMVELFNELYKYYGLNYYKYISQRIAKKTWVSKLMKKEKITTDTSPLKNIKYTLKDFQLKFVKSYETLKMRSNLRGYILSFDQGLGKTLTSIALAECLQKDKIYIVCPNSLKENWSYEIKAYFDKYEDEEVWKDEVFVIGNNKYRHTNKTKYYIVNQEAIPSMYPYVNKSNNMIVVDESHNFRNMNGKRVQELLKLREKLECEDTLMMSGTPIKATPNEIVPALLMIDPTFTIDVAKIYNKCFDVDDISTAKIVQKRFGRIIYRKTKKQVLTLPPKNQSLLNYRLPNGKKYLSKNVKELVNQRFSEMYAERLKDEDTLRFEFVVLLNKYSTSSRIKLRKYINWFDRNINTDNREEIHELTQNEIDNYIDDYVRPNIHDSKDMKRLDYLVNNFLGMRKSSMATALGEILPKYRRDMYVELYLENKDDIIEMIKEHPKKTVIFSTMLDVVHTISEDLEKAGMGVIKIIGGTSNRMEKIQQFKNDDTIDVLVATSQTLSTGVTLTEASQMFFFGTPWRSADYEQACDRIHRIGQTRPVHIYNVLLDTGNESNLSTRMQDILDWSDKMFSSMIDNEEYLYETKSYVDTEGYFLLEAVNKKIKDEYYRNRLKM